MSRPSIKCLEDSPAHRILNKFGGPTGFLKLAKRVCPEYVIHKSTVYRWLWPKDLGGTGGVIPGPALRDILILARYDGILLQF